MLEDVNPDPWSLPRLEPTTLIALWPGANPPMRAEIEAALARAAGAPIEIVGEIKGGGDVMWNMVVRLPHHCIETIVWVEPAEEMPSGALPEEAAECRWIVGFETLLDARDPVDSYSSMLRDIARTCDRARAVVDASTRQVIDRDVLDGLIDHDAPVPEEMLWIVDAVCEDGASGSDAPTWLHTHGLWRCGQPELEMLEVPRARTAAAGAALNAVAAFMLEGGLPAPGEPMRLGPELAVALQPWSAVARFVPERSPGGLSDREGEDNPHAGVRAVVCAPQPEGTFRKVWVWPRDVIEGFERGEQMVFRTKRATERDATLARRTWPELAMAFASTPSAAPNEPANQQALFLVKAGLQIGEGEDDAREHIWFIVRRFHGDRLHGEVNNKPAMISDLKLGDLLWLERGEVTDWLVKVSGERFGPRRARELTAAIERLRTGAAT